MPTQTRSTTLDRPITEPASTPRTALARPPVGTPAAPSPTTPRPTSASDTVFACASCEIEVHGRPTFHVGVAFCCAGCVVGGPCTCSYDEEPA